MKIVGIVDPETEYKPGRFLVEMSGDEIAMALGHSGSLGRDRYGNNPRKAGWRSPIDPLQVGAETNMADQWKSLQRLRSARTILTGLESSFEQLLGSLRPVEALIKVVTDEEAEVAK